MTGFVEECCIQVMEGTPISQDDARLLFESDITELATAANHITRHTRGDIIEIEQLYNIKKNGCSEDCTFCSQSAFFDTETDSYQLPPADEIVQGALRAKSQGATSYCLVAAWREPSDRDFEKVCDIILKIQAATDIGIECSLGFLSMEQAKTLKRLGVKRYNHNLETAPSKFAQICTTHTFQDRLDTLHKARTAGLELCTGGIIGIGETKSQRLELILEIAKLHPEEVTINMLVPIPGTPLELQTPLPPHEIGRVFAVMRFLLPQSTIKISGGRETATPDGGESLLRSGADGIITNGYLTIPGNTPTQDATMIRRMGLEA